MKNQLLKLMKNKSTLSIFLAALLGFSANGLCLAPPVSESAEDLVWVEPATVHDYKNRYDLHNITASALALSELEFVRLGDATVAFISRRKTEPLEKSADKVTLAYRNLPRVKPVERFGQLMDALQIRQLSLADARFFTGVAGGGGAGGGFAPIMQTRVQKLLVFVEDIIYDADDLVMMPLNVTATQIANKKVRVRSIGYAGDGIGFVREKVFSVLRVVNRFVTRTGAKLIRHGIESPADKVKALKKRGDSKNFPIYVLLDYAVFEKNSEFFKKLKKRSHVGMLEDWRRALRVDPLPEDLTRMKIPDLSGPIHGKNPRESVLIVTTLGQWEKAPEELLPYVIAPDEFRSVIQTGRIETSRDAEAFSS